MDCNLDNVKQMFERMAADGWDTSSPLQWGYFFFHGSRKPLVELQAALEEVGYKFQELHQAEDGQWVLQMSKVEVHTPQSLHKRNQEFNDLVEDWGIALYDGWDVGKVDA